MDLAPILLSHLHAINLIISLELLVLLLLLVLSALISGTEIAFFSLSKHQIEESKQKNKDIIKKQLETPKKLLATILIANNFINILFILIFTYVST